MKCTKMQKRRSTKTKLPKTLSLGIKWKMQSMSRALSLTHALTAVHWCTQPAYVHG